MDTSAAQEKPVESEDNPPKLCKPLDEQETLLLNEVAQIYFKEASEHMRSRVDLNPGQGIPNQQWIDTLCTLDYSIDGIVAHADNIRKFKNLPDKVTLTQGQSLYLEVLFKLNKVVDDIEDIARRIEELP